MTSRPSLIPKEYHPFICKDHLYTVINDLHSKNWAQQAQADKLYLYSAK